MRICVMGAGIAGLAAAYMLRRDGHEVTVVDRARAGSGASGGNGAQLSYSYVQPLAGPGIWAQLPKLLLSKDSPLKLRPQWDVNQWRWAFKFMLACNASRSLTTTDSLLAMAAVSRQWFELMLKEERLECDFAQSGKLVLYSSESALDAAIRQMELQRVLGGATQIAVGKSEVFRIEPALCETQATIAGAIYTPSECAADCAQVCRGLAKILARNGVEMLLDRPVRQLQRQGDQVVAAATDSGEIKADAFVMALGSESSSLSAKSGINLPLYPLKGYSITLDIPQGVDAPTVSITDADRKVVFARIGGRLRVAGFAELAGRDTSIPPARIQALKQASSTIFPAIAVTGDAKPWTGLRPATPTGVPIVGRLKGAPTNLLFNTGHGALGFTLAFGTAERLSALLARA